MLKIKRLNFMKKFLKLSVFLFLLSCESAYARQYNVGPYSKEREMNGRNCQQFFFYENGQERLINIQCN